MQEIAVTGATKIMTKLGSFTESILGSVAHKEYGLSWGLEHELRRLKETLEKIAPITDDAENRQGREVDVRVWLRKLKDIAYDAEDVLDEFSYEAMRAQETSAGKVNHFISFSSLRFRFKMAKKIKDINWKLDIISQSIASLQLCPSSACQASVQQSRLTSFGDDSKIVGREKDKSIIIEMLLMTMDAPLSFPSFKYLSQPSKNVVYIAGTGGLGKTTLARLVYQDDSIVRLFELRMWVCLSPDFDVNKIIRCILECIKETKCDDVLDVNIVSEVQRNLSDKKYLLVLDDVSMGVEEWEKLMTFIDVGAPGSRILVTTEELLVSSHVSRPYNLQPLSNFDCWSIIQHRAFSPGGASETPRMLTIGEGIARKCVGLPLAAKVLGSLMYSNNAESDWLSILHIKNDILETEYQTNILSTLKLSYDNLSPNLKQCFSYFSLFPKGWKINRETLIRLWLAEGFLHSHGENQKSLQDVGNDYFQILLSNSFFQDVERDELGDIKTFKMHGLVHDLAKDEGTILDASKLENSISDSRRVQIILNKNTSKTFSAALHDANKLRSIFSLENKFLDVNTLSSRKRLRVACLLGVHPLKSQSFTSDFKHLRYLDLSYSKIEELPNVSIKKLYNLQTLILYRCTNVHIILKDIGVLKLLEHLNLSYSDIHVLPESINQLRNLQTLNLYHCLQLEALPPLDIGSFRHLSRLDISYTPIIKLPPGLSSTISLRDFRFMFCRNLEALPDQLGALTLLRSLNLNGTGIKELPKSCVSTLKNLEIVELGSECELPKEIKDWPKLRRLTHRGKSYHQMPKGIEQLICLEELQSYMVRKEEVPATNHHSRIEELSSLNDLKVLVIRNLENVGGIEDAARAKLKDKQNIQLLELRWDGEGIDDSTKVLEGLQPHPNLKTLLIKGFIGMNLPEWMGRFDSSSSCLPNLVELKLRSCNSCEQLPPLGLLPCLRVLHIDGMNSVKCLGDEFYYHVPPSSSSSSPTSFTIFPSLIELKLSDMSSLEEWLPPPPQYSPSSFLSLRRLIISGCFQLRSIPLTSFSSLDSLELSNTNDKVVGSILAMEGGGGGKGKGSGSLITSISIQDSVQFSFFPMGVLQHYTHLQSLEISCCSKFQGFRIQNYNNSDEGVISPDIVFKYTCSSIYSLHSLKLRNCPCLTYLQDLREWKSLTKLWIENCDKLKKSFTYDLASLPSLRTLYVDRFIDLYASTTTAASTSHINDTLAVSLVEIAEDFDEKTDKCSPNLLSLQKCGTPSKKQSKTHKIRKSVSRAGSRSKGWFWRRNQDLVKFTRRSMQYEKLSSIPTQGLLRHDTVSGEGVLRSGIHLDNNTMFKLRSLILTSNNFTTVLK